MIQLSAVVSGSFAPTVQFEKLEIHTVFLRFSNFHLGQNFSLTTLANSISGYLSVCVDKIRRVRYDEKTIKGLIALSDRIKDESKQVIKDLQEQKIKCFMVTGDNDGAAKYASSILNISEIHSGKLPEDKAEIIINKSKNNCDFADTFNKYFFNDGDSVLSLYSLTKSFLFLISTSIFNSFFIFLLLKYVKWIPIR